MIAFVPSSRPFIFVLAVLLAGVPLTHVQTSSAQDLPDLDEIENAIKEARNIVARAGECTVIADDAASQAALADVAAMETTIYRDQAGASRILAEEAALAAKTAADLAEVAAEKAAAAAAAERALREAAAAEAAAAAAEPALREEVEGFTAQATSAERLEAPPPDISALLKRLADALQDARDAAEQAAKDAKNAAETARQAIADAMIAASTAEDAAEDSEAAGEAAMQAMDAAERAQNAADAAAQTAEGSGLTEVADAAKAAAAALAEARASEAASKDAAADAASSATNAGQYAEHAAEAATTAKAFAAGAEQCATEVSERESTLATARAASVYFSRTVVNRIQKLRPVGRTSFGSAARSSGGMTGINAGDDVLPDYPPNLAVDIGYSRSQNRQGLFDARSNYALILTDRLLTTKRLFGFGAGMEYTRESLLGGVDRRTRGITATAYLAEILTENITLVPQAAVTYLNKESETSDVSEVNKAIRGLGSLTVLRLTQRGGVELSAFGQFAYTHEEPVGSSTDDAVYLGQAIAGGEAAFPVWAEAHLFVGASLGYDVIRSESSGSRIGYGGNLGLRSWLGAATELSLSVIANRQDEEETLAGNVFVKVFF